MSDGELTAFIVIRLLSRLKITTRFVRPCKHVTYSIIAFATNTILRILTMTPNIFRIQQVHFALHKILAMLTNFFHDGLNSFSNQREQRRSPPLLRTLLPYRDRQSPSIIIGICHGLNVDGKIIFF